MMYKKYCLILMMVMTSVSLFSQNADEDIRKINEAYNNLASLKADLKIMAYETHTSKDPIDVQTGKLLYTPGMNYNQIGAIESIGHDAYKINLDHDEKMIVISKVLSSGSKTAGLDMLKVDFKEILKLCSDISYESLPSKKFRYTFTYSSSQYEKLVVEADKSTYLLTRLVFYYRQAQNFSGSEDDPKEKPRLEIVYENPEINTAIDTGLYDLEHYVYEKENKIVLKEKYKNYVLIDKYSTVK